MASGIFGWDLLYASVEKDIKTNQDVLICLTHLVLVSNGFKCIGLGESKNIDGSESKSESLPKGWTEEYALRYIYQGRLYNLKGTNLDDGIIINLVRVDERTVGSLQLNVRQVVVKSGTLDVMIPDNKNIVDQIKADLIDKVVVSTKTQEISCQTESSQSTSSSSMRRRFSDTIGPLPVVVGFPAPMPYGRSDLHPFPLPLEPYIPGVRPRPGGGMIFEPPRFEEPGNMGIPPGSLPPGARFDPFRPPQAFPTPRRPPNRPDNDEFPPPGYDDMFM